MKKNVAALLFALLIVAPCQSFAGVFLSVNLAPPPLPVYEQPLIPGAGYLWMPGYWAYDDEGWFWVPGAWVLPPEPGLYWTPGYWEWDGYADAYLWHAGYWAPEVGFYGGVAYGYGYPGSGYYGGYWDHGAFWYNSSCYHLDRRIIHNTYEKTVIVNKTVVKNVSYNGGPGRSKLLPTSVEMATAHGRHVAATTVQVNHRNLAMASRDAHFAVNHGKPAVTATSRAGDFTSRTSVGAGQPNGPRTSEPAGGVPTVRRFRAEARNTPADGNNVPAAIDTRRDLNASAPNTSRIIARGEGIQRIRPDDPRALKGEGFARRPDQRMNGGPRARVNLPGRSPEARTDGFAANNRGRSFVGGANPRRSADDRARDLRFR